MLLTEHLGWVFAVDAISCLGIEGSRSQVHGEHRSFKNKWTVQNKFDNQHTLTFFFVTLLLIEWGKGVVAVAF